VTTGIQKVFLREALERTNGGATACEIFKILVLKGALYRQREGADAGKVGFCPEETCLMIEIVKTGKSAAEKTVFETYEG